MPELTIMQVGPTVYRALGNDSKQDAVFYDFRSDRVEELSAWKENSAW